MIETIIHSNVNELIGMFGSGKTLLSLNYAMELCAKNPNAKILFIDSDDMWSKMFYRNTGYPSLLERICLSKGLEWNNVKNNFTNPNVIPHNSNTPFSQNFTPPNVLKIMKTSIELHKKHTYDLIIIDSLTKLTREMHGNNEETKRSILEVCNELIQVVKSTDSKLFFLSQTYRDSNMSITAFIDGIHQIKLSRDRENKVDVELENNTHINFLIEQNGTITW